MSSSKESLDGVSVKKEDQGNINKFARKNALLQELREELKFKKDALQDIEEGELSILIAQDPLIPYKVGEVFFELSHEKTQSMLDEDKTQCMQRIGQLEEEILGIESILQELKGELYARFGNNINLEPNPT